MVHWEVLISLVSAPKVLDVLDGAFIFSFLSIGVYKRKKFGGKVWRLNFKIFKIRKFYILRNI